MQQQHINNIMCALTCDFRMFSHVCTCEAIIQHTCFRMVSCTCEESSIYQHAIMSSILSSCHKTMPSVTFYSMLCACAPLSYQRLWQNEAGLCGPATPSSLDASTSTSTSTGGGSFGTRSCSTASDSEVDPAATAADAWPAPSAGSTAIGANGLIPAPVIAATAADCHHPHAGGGATASV